MSLYRLGYAVMFILFDLAVLNRNGYDTYTDITNSMELRPPAVQPLVNLPAFYGTRRFITELARALHLSVPLARPIKSIASRSHLYTRSSSSPFVLHASHPPWLHHSYYTWGRVQIMNLLVMQLSSATHHLISLRSKYSPQYPVFKHPQSMFNP
jgi:hypothetical protein